MTEFFTAVKEGDTDKAFRCLVTQPKHDPTLIEATVKINLALNRLFTEGDKAYGSNSSLLRNGTITLDSVAQLFNSMGIAGSTIHGDTAEISAEIPDAVIGMLPATMRSIVSAWSKAPMRFVKESDGWKFDLNHSMRVDMQTDAPHTTPEATDLTNIQITEAQAASADEVAASIRNGELPTALSARRVMDANVSNILADHAAHRLSTSILPIKNP